jgi:hypothetical protein
MEGAIKQEIERLTFKEIKKERGGVMQWVRVGWWWEREREMMMVERERGDNVFYMKISSRDEMGKIKF